MRHLRILGCLLLVTSSLGVLAFPQEEGGQTSPCEGTGTQAEANACARYQHKQADAEMNQAYEQLMAELGEEMDEGRQKLRRAQALWLEYRDATCESEASIYKGGSIRPAVYSSCMASVTRERTGRLREFLASLRE